MENSLVSYKNEIIDKFDNEEDISLISNITVNDIMIWVLESKDSVLIKGSLPGVEQKDIRIDYKNGDITLNVTQKTVREASGIGFVSYMSTSSSFTRDVHVGEVDISNLNFEYINNMLTLYLPKFKIVEASFEEIN